MNIKSADILIEETGKRKNLIKSKNRLNYINRSEEYSFYFYFYEHNENIENFVV